jgi:RHS repeat-associated protein
MLDIADCMGAACNVQPGGATATAYGDPAPRGAAYDPPWNGTLLENGRTGSGLLYRRNRYLDANTGSFTQTDPVGIGGGLSAYGFGDGDPVNYPDPFGLCTPMPECLEGFGSLTNALRDIGRGAASAMNEAGSNLLKFAKAHKEDFINLAVLLASRGEAGEEGLRWPSTAEEMDKMLKVPGTRVPDLATTPGRGKVVWRPNSRTKITFEQHPYHPEAPDFHRNPHWHLETPEQRTRFRPGDVIPNSQNP